MQFKHLVNNMALVTWAKKIFLSYLPAKSIKKSSVLKISPRPALATNFRAIVDFPLRLFVERKKLFVIIPSG